MAATLDAPLISWIDPALDADIVAQIWAAIRTVPDPEIPVVSVAELGIIRGLVADRSGKARLQITPTYTGCPATSVIQASLRQALDHAQLADVEITTVLSPPWGTDMISPSGHEKLRAYGIAPPHAADHGAPAQCPRCGSRETSEVSRFGSTPCKALWRCNACLEPFDRFKCH